MSAFMFESIQILGLNLFRTTRFLDDPYRKEGGSTLTIFLVTSFSTSILKESLGKAFCSHRAKKNSRCL